MADTHFAAALHALTALAAADGLRVTSGDLAGSIRTTDAFVRRVMASLKDAGLIATDRGAKGGLRLARPASDISLAEVYKAVRGEALLRPAAAVPNPDCPVGSRIGPVVGRIFEDAETALILSLSNINLADVVKAVKAAPSSRTDH